MGHHRGLAAVGGELSFATGLPGKEFPATAAPIPKASSISRNYPLPSCSDFLYFSK